MEKEYRSNLCTFMGRRNNVEILHKYIEEALKINAIDRYYMIDMTRNIDDHNLIQSEKDRLNEKFPGRVFVHNDDKQKQLLESGEEIVGGSWAPFYSFLDSFEDNDVIIKCDDDTLYIDVETLEAACELRWKNKDPLLMHANCINNGITAYHQYKKGIWDGLKDKDLIDMFPSGGLTGPLFAHPDVACDMHMQFASDLKFNETSIEKYKLKENIYFNCRVSINFIFMLGSDRDILKTIDTQDEYVTSSKAGQAVDRPNMIIGDFTCLHHTYGRQEPVMEERGTYDILKRLADRLFSTDRERVRKPITDTFNSVSSVKSGPQYLFKYWSTSNSYTLKHKETQKYISIVPEKAERLDPKTKEGNGVFWLKNVLTGDSDDPTLFEVENDNIVSVTELIKATNPNPKNPQFLAFLINKFFQQNYKNNQIKIHKKGKEAIIESVQSPGYYLIKNPNNPKLLFFKNVPETEADVWVLETYKPHQHKVLLADIIRDDLDSVENDPTYAVASHEDLPDLNTPRGFYWTVYGHIWEFIKQKNDQYHIRVVSDTDAFYLNCTDDNILAKKGKKLWKIDKLATGCRITCPDTNKVVSITPTGDVILDRGSNQSNQQLFDINL